MEKPKQRPWRTLSCEYLAREPWFTVRRQRMELPDGRIIPSYYVLEYPAWVNVIARTAEGDFVMVSQFRPGLARTDYELVAGVVDPEDQTMEAAARRELEEETGYGGGRWRQLMVLSANPATHNNLTYCFVAEGVEPVAARHPDPTEELDLHLLTGDQVRELLVAGEIPQALHAAPLWRYFAEERLL